MNIVAMDFADIRIGHYNEWQVTKRPNSVRKASGKDRKRKVRGVEQLLR